MSKFIVAPMATVVGDANVIFAPMATVVEGVKMEIEMDVSDVIGPPRRRWSRYIDGSDVIGPPR